MTTVGKPKLSFHMRENAIPHFHALRHAPIQVMDKLKAELKCMTELSVIEPVTESTDWVSSLMYITKACVLIPGFEPSALGL